MFMAIALLGVLPLLNKSKPGCRFSPFNQVIFWCFVVNFFLLSYIGACPVEAPYEIIGRVLSVLYLSLFIIDPIIKKYLHNPLLNF